LPRGVESVKKITKSKCGLDIQVEVDNGGEPIPKRRVIVLRACFIQPDGTLDSHLRLEESK
jgi:hypothetical protein